MKVLYFDCFAGLNGGMVVGALCDLGVKPSTLEWELSKVELGDFHMHFERKHRSNLEGVAFSIHEGATHRHDSGAEHTHPHAQGEECGHGHHHHHEGGEHDHEEDHEHAHEHDHDHDHSHAHAHGGEDHGDEPEEPAAHDHEHGSEVGHAHHHHHHTHGHPEAPHRHQSGGDSHGRSPHEIRALIEKSDLSPFVKQHALSIFHRVAEAEGKVTGRSVELVTSHESGALRSIANVICTCAGLEELAVGAVHVSVLNEGTGLKEGRHGQVPLPSPLTLEILKGAKIGQVDEAQELITPIGAAIMAEFGQSFGPMPPLTVQKIGYGVGELTLKSRPNVLRAVLGESAS